MNDIISLFGSASVHLFSLLYTFYNLIPFTKFEIATGFREFTCMYLGVAIFGLAVYIKI